MNRSTIYEFLEKDTDLKFSFVHINKGRYMIYIVPYSWKHSYLLINSVRISDFQSIILFSNELVVRFAVNEDCQINIPYRYIEYIAVRKDLNLGYLGLHEKDGKQWYDE